MNEDLFKNIRTIEQQKLLNNLEQEFNDFFIMLLDKYKVTIDEELINDLGFENDYYNLLNAIDEHLSSVFDFSNKQKELTNKQDDIIHDERINDKDDDEDSDELK
jgi:hypothetical protein